MTVEERLARLEKDLYETRVDVLGITKIAYALIEAAKEHMPPDVKATLIKRLQVQAHGNQNETAQSFATELLQFLRG